MTAGFQSRLCPPLMPACLLHYPTCL